LNPLRIAEFDIGRRLQRQIEMPTDEQRLFLGGAGMAAWILHRRLRPDLNPLDPEAPLILMTGPLTGTAGPAVGRMVVAARSPATRLWGESNIGGSIGPALRQAGLDGLVLVGRAPEPSYLWVHEGVIEVRPAGHLWGSADTYQTQTAIREELAVPGTRVACIGLAGEAGLPMAAIVTDHGRVAGRTGLGAVLGSKRIKAIACSGVEPVSLAAPESFSRVRRSANIELRGDNLSRALREVGTAGSIEYFGHIGTLTGRYYTRAGPEGLEAVSGTTVAEELLIRPSTCHGCVIACGRVVRLEDGSEHKGAEYETTVGFGPNLGVEDPQFIARMGELCDKYGLDTISVANVIGLAFRLFEVGAISQERAGGVSLVWGDLNTIETLIHQIARREGLGAELAQGAAALAMSVDRPEMAAEVKGLEVPFHDPRGASGMALVYATSPRGACHNQGDYYLVDGLGHTNEEIGVKLFDRYDGAAKAANVARHQDWRSCGNNLVLCIFANVPNETCRSLVEHATGFDVSLAELMKVGERSWNLKRVINLRLGMTRSQDRLPGVFMSPLPQGVPAGRVPPFDEMLEAYEVTRGWDHVSGWPRPETLERLGLGHLSGGEGAAPSSGGYP
jgi:aldehyde:ferredoxin oxidoreductase